MAQNYITNCVECGRDLEAFEGDICESCWALEYEQDDDYYEPKEPPTRWQRFKWTLHMFYLRVRNRLIPMDIDDIPF